MICKILHICVLALHLIANEDYYPIENTYIFFNDTHKIDNCFNVFVEDDNIAESDENFIVRFDVPERKQDEPQFIDMQTHSLMITIRDDDSSSGMIIIVWCVCMAILSI